MRELTNLDSLEGCSGFSLKGLSKRNKLRADLVNSLHIEEFRGNKNLERSGYKREIGTQSSFTVFQTIEEELIM